MKRSSPPQSRTRLTADPASVRAWQDRTRKALPAQSQRRKAERPTRAAVLDEVRARDGFSCWVAAAGLLVLEPCRSWDPDRPLLEGHEVIPRSAWPGGHLVASNVRMLCQAHHDWVTEHEPEAHALGLHGYSWERPPS